MLKIKRLGIDWGAAHEEATPVRISSNDAAEIEVYQNEGGDICIELPPTAIIRCGTRKGVPIFSVTIPDGF